MASANYGRIESLNSQFATRLQALFSDAQAAGHSLKVGSALRTKAEQQALYDEAMRKYGRNDLPGHQVAKPGSSRHESGLATDLEGSKAAKAWANVNASRYGIRFAVKGEDWHAEPVEIGGAKPPSGFAPIDVKAAKSAFTTGGTTVAKTSGVPGSTVDKVLATIRKRESGGDYTQPGSKLGGSASGAYQFIDSTWRSAAGKDIAAKYPRAYMAPASVQDAVARKEVQRILDQNGGNVKAVPAYWFYPAGAKKALSGVDVQPPNPKNPTMLTYINGWMKDYEKTTGQAGTGSGEAARLGTTSASAATATPVIGGALGALTSFTGAPGASMPTQPYVPATTLPDLGMTQPSQELPMPGMDAQARTSALNLLMQMGASGATGRMRIMFDPRTGKTVTVPAGG